MPKTYRLAILADRRKQHLSDKYLSGETVTSYTYITAESYSHIKFLADRIGAVVCGWRVAA